VRLSVALIAEESAGARSLDLVSARGHEVAAVFTSTGGAGPMSTVAVRARSLGIPVREAHEVREASTAEWLRARGVDLLLNVHSLHILHGDVLDAPTLGAYNLHPGPLPERAGLDTPSWALYEGACRYGVTLHRMTQVVDAGTIAFADDFDIGPTDTGLAVMMQCVRRGVRLIEQLLTFAERGDRIPSRPQDLARRRWFSAGPPNDGRLEWGRPARQITDFVRACDYRPLASPWGFPRCQAGDAEIAILTARVMDRATDAIPGTVISADRGAVAVAASDAWVRVDDVAVAGRPTAAADAIGNVRRLR
jgi:methionyl-tRNA formyltransferase